MYRNVFHCNTCIIYAEVTCSLSNVTLYVNIIYFAGFKHKLRRRLIVMIDSEGATGPRKDVQCRE
jgi:hypothetical protein